MCYRNGTHLFQWRWYNNVDRTGMVSHDMRFVAIGPETVTSLCSNVGWLPSGGREDIASLRFKDRNELWVFKFTKEWR